MAPFLTHLAVGEGVWLRLDGRQPRPKAYGTFLLGCLAPDVDKFWPDLEQGTTHFLPKDRDRTWTERRTRHFLARPADFLVAPFCEMAAVEQSFVLGYLCHVAADEVTGRLGTQIMTEFATAGQVLPNVDAILTAMDPLLWAEARDAAGIVAALERARLPNGAFPFLPAGGLAALHRAVLPQVREGGGLLPYTHFRRRLENWKRHGQVSDDKEDAELEAELAAWQQRVEADLPGCQRLVASLDMERYFAEAVEHSLACSEALLLKEARS
ncbi:MAG: zinc dependent phospholipase C family protein [Anaerolineae bacterium]|jgi:hypothetical protein